MPSEAQEQFFQKLTEERDFGDKDIPTIREQFMSLDQRNASQWIERALELPEKGEIKPTF